MQLNQYSKDQIAHSLNGYGISLNSSRPLVQYLVYGFHPGSFFNSVIANDLSGALLHADHNKTLNELHSIVSWITQCWPARSFGSDKSVKTWRMIKREIRFNYLREHNLIFTSEIETIKELRGDPFLCPKTITDKLF